MTRTHTVIGSPFGELKLVGMDGVLSGVYMEEHRHMPDPSTFGPRVSSGFRQASEQLEEYFSGERREEELGDLTAIRAVAAANGRNPLSVIVPCHRVVGSDGSLTGYAGGFERKRFLLDLETPADRKGRPTFLRTGPHVTGSRDVYMV